MDPAAKKTALRMIPYGLYVLTAESQDGQIAAATVNWVTQASFEPPLVVVGVKTDSSAFGVIKASGACRASSCSRDTGKQQQIRGGNRQETRLFFPRHRAMVA